MSLSWLPNAITLLRVALVGPVVWLIVQGQYPFAILLFFIAGFSDGVDGYLAKNFGWHTRVGALIDPLADKLLLACSFITLAWVGLVPVWLAALVVFRDLVIIGGAAAYHCLVGPVPGEPTRISKLNTGLELLFVLSVLSRSAWSWPQEISIVVLGAAVYVTVVISGIDYVWSWSLRARADSRASRQ